MKISGRNWSAAVQVCARWYVSSLKAVAPVQAALTNLVNQNLPCIIVRDVNTDLIKWNSHNQTAEYSNLLY